MKKMIFMKTIAIVMVLAIILGIVPSINVSSMVYAVDGTPLLTVEVAPGATSGSTKATVTDAVYGDLTVDITVIEVSTPDVGDAVPTSGDNLISDYTSGADITTGVAANKYLQIYDSDGEGKVAGFYQQQITAGDINTEGQKDYAITLSGGFFKVDGAGEYQTLAAALADCTNAGGDGELIIKLGDTDAPLLLPQVDRHSPANNQLITGTYTGNVQIQNVDEWHRAGLFIPSGVTATFRDLTITQTGTAGLVFNMAELADGGTLNIEEGTSLTLSCSDGTGIYNDGTVNMTGGVLSATGENGKTIDNYTGGTLNISGGTVNVGTDADYPIKNQSTLSISGTAVISGVSTGIYNTGNDADIDISGGTIEATGANGNALYTSGTGTINMTGGTIRATDTSTGNNHGIYNSNSFINISGGTVSCDGIGFNGAAAIYQWNSATAVITISGTANIIGAKNGIYNSGTKTTDNGAIYITGGTVTSTGVDGSGGLAINNQGTGLLTIAGGTVEVAGSNATAVNNNNTGTINITGGTVQATNSTNNDNYAISVPYGGTVNISGGMVCSAGTGTSASAIRLNNPPVGEITVSTANISGNPRIISASGNTVKLARNGSFADAEKCVVFGKTLYSDTLADVVITGTTVDGKKEINSTNYGDAAVTASSITTGKSFIGWMSDSERTTTISTTNGATISSLTTGENDGVTDIYLKAGVPAPGVLPTNGSFTDIDMDADEIGGTITWTAADPASGIDGYKIYWGSNETTKLAGNDVVVYTAAAAGTESQSVAAGTALPAGATHFLIYSYNDSGESANCMAVPIDDKQSFTDANNNTYVFIVNADDRGIIIDFTSGGSTEVVIPDTINGKAVTHIGNTAFKSKGLTEITIPESVYAIGDEAFSWNQLEEVIIPNNVTSIGNKAFEYNHNTLTSVTLGSGLESIGDYAFFNCKLDGIIITDNVETIGQQAFAGGENNIKSITLGSGLVSVGDYAFSNHESQHIAIPASVTTIGTQAFGSSEYEGVDLIIYGNEGSAAQTYANIRMHTFIAINGTLAGNGTEDSPYLIQSKEDLLWMSYCNEAYDGFEGLYFEQTCDIDMSSVGNFLPIGNPSSSFKGKYDGGGNTISGLKEDAVNKSTVGLFGEIGASGEVKSVTLEDISIQSISNQDVYVGGIAGSNYGTILDCHIKVSDEGQSLITGISDETIFSGGIAGHNKSTGTISRCSNNAGVEAGTETEGDFYRIGGITGVNDGTLNNCYNTGDISNKDSNVSEGIFLGGISALNMNEGSISFCYNTGEINLTGESNFYIKGGIAAVTLDLTKISNSFNLNSTADFAFLYPSGQGGFDTSTAGVATEDELKTPATFNGWDTDIWTFVQGSIPALKGLDSAPTYTVTYNGNGNAGGDVPTDGNSYEEGDTATVTGNTGNLTKTGYIFVGWNTASDGSGTSYAADDTFNMDSCNVTLYAKWEEDPDYLYNYIDNGDGTATITEFTLLSSTNIVIPDELGGLTVTRIGDESFYDKGLTGVTFPSTVTHIGENAFMLNPITEIEIPQSVVSIGDYAFSVMGAPFQPTVLASVVFAPDSALETIGESAFYNNQLESLALPDSVTSIGASAFTNNKLESLTMGSSTEDIGGYAFSNNQLTSLTVPDSVTSIGDGAFLGNQIENVSLGNSIVSIGSGAFYNNKLTTVEIPASVTSIATEAFASNQSVAADLTIAGSSGSVAKTYAEENGHTFESLDAQTYTVTYNGNGNTGGGVPTDGNSYEEGDTVTVMGNTGSLTKTGYTFAGWNTALDGSGTSYAADDTFNMGSSNVILYTKWTVVNNGSGGSSGSSRPTPPPSNTVDVTVDGKTEEQASTVSTQTQGNKTMTTVTLDTQKIIETVNTAQTGSKVTVPITGEADVAVGELNGQLVKAMETKQAVIEIKTDSAAYTLPAQEINIDDVSAQIGQDVSLTDIKVSIEIAKTSEEKVKVVEDSAVKGNFSIVVPPNDFTVKCTYGSKTVENHWAKDAVNDMGSRLVISGVGEDRFDPDRDITRAEFAAIVVRTLGLMQHESGEDIFSDVPEDAWYHDAVSTAYEYGIISGYEDGRFGPDDKITREQAMVMIARAMKITGLKAQFEAGQADSILTGFADTDRASGYAKDSIAACVKTGIVSGRGANLVVLKGNITRAEVAAMVQGLLKKSNLI